MPDQTTPSPAPIAPDEELCRDCDRSDSLYWVESTTSSDTWACAACGSTWTVPIGPLGETLW
jgi:DNA-directed RNA polymerase subunit M/transcription elongation factor TFIIS